MGLDIVWKNDALALPKVVAKVSLKKIYKMEKQTSSIYYDPGGVHVYGYLRWYP